MLVEGVMKYKFKIKLKITVVWQKKPRSLIEKIKAQ
jgi:hypothetical protein